MSAGGYLGNPNSRRAALEHVGVLGLELETGDTVIVVVREIEGVLAEEHAEHKASLGLEQIGLRMRAVARATAQSFAVEGPGRTRSDRAAASRVLSALT